MNDLNGFIGLIVLYLLVAVTLRLIYGKWK